MKTIKYFCDTYLYQSWNTEFATIADAVSHFKKHEQPKLVSELLGELESYSKDRNPETTKLFRSVSGEANPKEIAEEILAALKD